jgi:hypothetical protein
MASIRQGCQLGRTKRRGSRSAPGMSFLVSCLGSGWWLKSVTSLGMSSTLPRKPGREPYLHDLNRVTGPGTPASHDHQVSRSALDHLYPNHDACSKGLIAWQHMYASVINVQAEPFPVALLLAAFTAQAAAPHRPCFQPPANTDDTRMKSMLSVGIIWLLYRMVSLPLSERELRQGCSSTVHNTHVAALLGDTTSASKEENFDVVLRVPYARAGAAVKFLSDEPLTNHAGFVQELRNPSPV